MAQLSLNDKKKQKKRISSEKAEKSIYMDLDTVVSRLFKIYAK